MSGPPPLSGRFRAAAFGAARDLLACLRFFSRLPLPELPFEQGAGGMADLPRLAWMVPVAGAVLSAIGALALGLADGLGLPPLVCAGLAIGVLVILTGALHEDGLADLADGFGGGATRERKLEIMRDSRVGAYGATALALSLILRVAAVSALLDRSLGVAAAGLILAGAASRAASLAPLALLSPARADGLGAGAGRLDGARALAAGGSALVIALLLGLGVVGLGRAALALALALAAALAVAGLARRQIGGQTGDVAGAAQQMAEIACLCGLLIGRGGA
ncbi:MAG: adenosylcobinamide-GDP ribazoletransferase [Roseiarcus sp.]